MNHNDLYIVDNSSEKLSVKEYLVDWCKVSRQMDIATGYLEIGGLLELDSHWQRLDKIRIIMGHEMTRRTKDVVEAAAKLLIDKFNRSVDEENIENEFLVGVPAILEALKSKKIECKVFNKNKFHAKAYISYFRDEYSRTFIHSMNVPSGYALVGSSNFTAAGLTQNIELNVQINQGVGQLQEWYEMHWEQGEDISEAIIEVIEKHTREFSPHDVYARSLYEFFKNQEKSVSEWERNDSVIFKKLSQYQRDGYNSLVGIASRYSGAFLCDGVGLGKTFVGMMLIERFVKKERKNVVLVVPASARVSVWETTINRYIPEILDGFFPFKIINHTDLLLAKNENLVGHIQEQAEIVLIDEAHHFRNRSSNRYAKLYDVMQKGQHKQIFMLTATPINNSFLDLQHLIELFTHRQEDYFASAPLGIHSLSGHFKKMEASLKIKIRDDLGESCDMGIADSLSVSEDIFRADPLVNELVVQRSRAYVKQSLSTSEGDTVLFSKREAPIVANYSLRNSYGKLIDHFVSSFYRKDKNTGRTLPPILMLAVYSPYEDEYFLGDKTKIDKMESGRQQQVVNLIRQLLLKRFESSVAAFKETCIRIYFRLYTFLNDYKEQGNLRLIERSLIRQEKVLEYVKVFIEKEMSTPLEDFEDELPEYVWELSTNKLSAADFNIPVMLDDTLLDMEVLAEFIADIMDFDSDKDDKIRELKRILNEDPRVQDKKVIIFSEYRSTARYIYEELRKAGYEGLYEVDGQSKENRHDIVVRFSPYYNGSSSFDTKNEIRLLIATDVLAEGLNLQDASCLINYDLHWNPVRLMQRIGRVDRRRNVKVEERLLADHPELAKDRPSAYYWNFLPPNELEELLRLYHTVSKKTLRISRAFGIEGKMLLTPEDDFEALKDFNSQYEGVATLDEQISLAYQEMRVKNPHFEAEMLRYPKKMYSGRRSIVCKGVFFCYELPIRRKDNSWSKGDGIRRWYIIDETGRITERPYDIWKIIKCDKEEPRCLTVSAEDFFIKRKHIENYINKTYMRAVQAPLGVKANLVTWMQLN